MEVTLEAFQKRYQYKSPNDLIGKGGFSEVYKAWDKEDEQFVALKIATVITSEKYSLASEVKKIKKLKHPNLIEYYEIYEVSTGTKDIHGNALNYQVAVMEYADGGTLADLLKIRPLTSDEVHDLAQGIINGLAYLHDNNIIHRDLKPANILLTNTDGKRIPKITDFGIAKNITVDNTASTLLVGTVEYMAPEYFRQEETQITTSAADVWSLGVILLEIVTGTHPFGKTSTGKSNERIIYSIISADLTSALQNLHTPLKELITRCLIQDPNLRPHSAADLNKLLEPGGDDFSEKTKPIVILKKHEESEKKKREIEIAEKLAEKKRKRRYVVAALLFLIILPIGVYLGYQKYNNDKLSNGIADNMVFVEGGTFTMGCTFEQGSECRIDEIPSHSVILKSFGISKYEVTQAQWQAVMGNNPSYNKNCEKCPVENVSWNDIQGFISRLNLQKGQHYRLPTEAEWEYAARGGNKSSGYKYSGSNSINEVAWFFDNCNKTHEVGQKQANELGLYDMSGNVLEWCADWFHAEYYNQSPKSNPTGSVSGKWRVLRCGSWGSFDTDCRVTTRGGAKPGIGRNNIGVRLAQDL